MKFKVTVREILERYVEIEADDPDDAIARAEEEYRNGNIVLDSEDFSYFEIKPQ